ncbi:MAG: hypothetical protein RJB14_210, partial [Pseudomonadota bacterium]
WIWWGAVFMVLGGALAAWDRRYRQVRVARSALLGPGPFASSVTTPSTAPSTAPGMAPGTAPLDAPGLGRGHTSEVMKVMS